jgi:hypothetical protein
MIHRRRFNRLDVPMAISKLCHQAAPESVFFWVVDECKIHVMILGLSPHSKSSSSDASKDDTDKLSKRGRIQRLHSLVATTFGIRSVNTTARDRSLRRHACTLEPVDKVKKNS